MEPNDANGRSASTWGVIRIAVTEVSKNEMGPLVLSIHVTYLVLLILKDSFFSGPQTAMYTQGPLTFSQPVDK